MERDDCGTCVLQIIWEPKPVDGVPETSEGYADQVLDHIALHSEQMGTYTLHWDSRTGQQPISRIQFGSSAPVVLATPKWRSAR